MLASVHTNMARRLLCCLMALMLLCLVVELEAKPWSFLTQLQEILGGREKRVSLSIGSDHDLALYCINVIEHECTTVLLYAASAACVSQCWIVHFLVANCVGSLDVSSCSMSHVWFMWLSA